MLWCNIVGPPKDDIGVRYKGEVHMLMYRYF